MLALATEAGQRLGVQIGVRGGAVLLRHLMPDHVGAMLAVVEARGRARPVCPPVRLAAAMFPADPQSRASPWQN
eukprot:10966327-Lingulodinium_polyedra.AAC.1